MFALATVALSVFTASAQEVKFEEYDLDNGLHVILHQDNTAPVITVGAMHDVGGKDLGGDNNPERTGFAHFFEHGNTHLADFNLSGGVVLVPTCLVYLWTFSVGSMK